MKFILVALLFLLPTSSSADDFLRTIGDFTLTTVAGEEVTLSNHSEELVAIYIQGNGCPIARLGSHDYKEVINQFAGKPVAFYMMNSFIQDSVYAIIQEEAKFEFAVPIMKDDTQSVAKTLGVTRTADVFLIRPKTGEVVYRGPINDKLGYETQRTDVTENYLSDGLNTVLSGGTVDHSVIPDSKGCLVALF
jgi:peroxiredoxin